MPRSFRYSRWDGTQAGFELDADEILSRLTDDVIYHGDLDAALRRLLQSGWRTPDGEELAGLRELLERLRRRRREELSRNDLGGVFEEIARELREIVAEERSAVDRMEGESRRSGDPRQRELGEAAAAERRLRLNLLPSDLAGQVRELSSYDFGSPEAGQRFEELTERLRQQLLQSRFNQMAASMSDVSPEHLQRVKDMLAALNAMLEQRARGAEPDFEGFMARFGDMFPGNPRTLDELLEQMAAQMAAFQSLLNSMTPQQRAELARLSEQLLDDVDLRWQVDQLGRSLQGLFPDMGWDEGYRTSGQDPLGLLDAVQLVDRLGQIDQLERLLAGATSPAALAEVDPDVARELLGDDGARSLERLAELARRLEEAGLIERREGRTELTPRGMRRIGQHALSDVFARLARDRMGRHAVEREGPGHERSYDTKPYEFGDPFNLNIERTIRNGLRRSGGGLPVSLEPGDFEVERTEALTRASTVLLLDLSLSMPMRDNFLAAKKTAVALHSLISSRFPTDYLGIVGFSEVARALRPEQLPEVSWDFVFGTNIQHALLLARRMLAGRAGSRQVVMITDGEPTAHLLPDGEPLFHYPPTPETIEATLAEVVRCTRAGIRINTFMLDATPHLQAFVERVSRINRGRVFFTTPDTLGDYVLVDFIDQKRSASRRRGRSA
ncbi:MAG TPA: VWA domain-containing protein [Acidimicrobiales bacterium]|nr:VWA domain-containing protein [Acidimicrobiales bacterium]